MGKALHTYICGKPYVANNIKNRALLNLIFTLLAAEYGGLQSMNSD